MTEKERILIVENDNDVKELLLNTLKQEGYYTDLIESIEEALVKINNDKFALYIIDIEILQVEKFDVLKKIKDSNPYSVIILISSTTSDPAAISVLMDGADDYITKPIDLDRLAHLIKKALEHRQLRIENSRLKEKLDKMFLQADETGEKSLSAMEKKYILKVLNENKWNISRSAQILEIDRVTLYNKINKYGLRQLSNQVP